MTVTAAAAANSVSCRALTVYSSSTASLYAAQPSRRAFVTTTISGRTSITNRNSVQTPISTYLMHRPSFSLCGSLTFCMEVMPSPMISS